MNLIDNHEIKVIGFDNLICVVNKISGYPAILHSTFGIPQTWPKNFHPWEWEMVSKQNSLPNTLPSIKTAPFCILAFL